MNSKGFTKQLNERINALSEGKPFIASDFADITDAQTIRGLLKMNYLVNVVFFLWNS